MIVLSFLSDKKLICNIFVKGKWIEEIGDDLVMESDNIITLISTKGVVNLFEECDERRTRAYPVLAVKKFIL